MPIQPGTTLGEHGENIGGPPWILGHRGAPREAPENTLASLRRALELGLDGFEYDLHACAGGEPVLLHDETLERTTNLSGPIAVHSLTELVHADAGSWFSRSFAGEPLPLLEEALELDGGLDGGERAVHHMIELKDPSLVATVGRSLARLARPLPYRIASFHRSVCLEARDSGLPSMLLAEEASEADRRFVRDERIPAYGTGPGGWRSPAGREDWGCERWSWSVDEPDDLLAACRAPLFALNTNEPLRALAARALTQLAPEDRGPYPLEVPRLEVLRAFGPSAREGERTELGEWSGRWEFALGVRNPFPFPVRCALALRARGGAFQCRGLPATLGLDAHARAELPIELGGGSWSPHDDPCVALRFAWRHGRASAALVLDAPLARVRTLELGEGARRVRLLRERDADREASMTLRRRGAEVVAGVEDAGGLTDVQATIRIGHRVRTGRRGVRIRLPEEFPSEGAPFSVGFEGADPASGQRRLRRFAGGLPYGLGSGAPGRLRLG